MCQALGNVETLSSISRNKENYLDFVTNIGLQ